MNYKVTIAYDGTDYYGWQIQLGKPTIQELISRALAVIEGAPVTLHGAGRTDSGVHAEGQVGSFKLSKEWNPLVLRRALNGNLPPDIRVLEAETVGEDFHARASALRKTYRYQIYHAEVMLPPLVRFAQHYAYALDYERMVADAAALVGTHDFQAFTVSDIETKTTVRTLLDIHIRRDGSLWQLFFTGDGFLRYQVRTMVAALIEANREQPGTVRELIASRDRRRIGRAAPAKGLTLMTVEY